MMLVLVLILLGLITALALQAQMVARMALRIGEGKALRAQLRAAATDTAWGALHRLAGDADLQVDHTNEPWAVTEERLLLNGIDTWVRIEDENRRFDVNSLSVRLSADTGRMPVDIITDLLRLLRQPDPAVQAQALKDWIDQDHDGLRETDYYRNLKPPVTIADAFMESPRELAAVLAWSGSSGDLPAGVPAGIAVLPARDTASGAVGGPARNTAHSAVGGPVRNAAPASGRRIMPVNLNTADREVILAVLGPEHAGAAAMLCGLRDAGPLVSLTALNRLLKASPDNSWNRYFDVKSSFFSVMARASKNGRVEEIYALVCRDPQGNVDILRWLCR